MAISREDKLKSLFKKLTAGFLKNELDTHSLVTVTDIALSRNGNKALALVSVFPEKSEDGVLKILKQKEGALRKFYASQTKMKFVPRVEFKIDKGEKNRQRIETLLSQS